MQNSENNAWQEYIEKNFKSKGARTFVESLLVSKNNKQAPLLEYLDELITQKIENQNNQNVENIETKEETAKRHDKYARQLENLNKKYDKKKAELDKVQKKYDNIMKTINEMESEFRVNDIQDKALLDSFTSPLYSEMTDYIEKMEKLNEELDDIEWRRQDLEINKKKI